MDVRTKMGYEDTNGNDKSNGSAGIEQNKNRAKKEYAEKIKGIARSNWGVAILNLLAGVLITVANIAIFNIQFSADLQMTGLAVLGFIIWLSTSVIMGECVGGERISFSIFMFFDWLLFSIIANWMVHGYRFAFAGDVMPLNVGLLIISIVANGGCLCIAAILQVLD